jgi:hypothetical protein
VFLSRGLIPPLLSSHKPVLVFLSRGLFLPLDSRGNKWRD